MIVIIIVITAFLADIRSTATVATSDSNAKALDGRLKSLNNVARKNNNLSFANAKRRQSTLNEQSAQKTGEGAGNEVDNKSEKNHIPIELIKNIPSITDEKHGTKQNAKQLHDKGEVIRNKNKSKTNRFDKLKSIAKGRKSDDNDDGILSQEFEEFKRTGTVNPWQLSSRMNRKPKLNKIITELDPKITQKLLDEIESEERKLFSDVFSGEEQEEDEGTTALFGDELLVHNNKGIRITTPTIANSSDTYQRPENGNEDQDGNAEETSQSAPKISAKEFYEKTVDEILSSKGPVHNEVSPGIQQLTDKSISLANSSNSSDNTPTGAELDELSKEFFEIEDRNNTEEVKATDGSTFDNLDKFSDATLADDKSSNIAQPQLLEDNINGNSVNSNTGI